MTMFSTAPAGGLAGPAEPGNSTPGQLRIAAVEPVLGPGTVRGQVALSHWLVAVVQAPVGLGPADLHEAFQLGAAWPLIPWPAGFRLLGYLAPNDLPTT